MEPIEVNFITCRQCDSTIYYTPASTVIYYYSDYPRYSVAQSYCDVCDLKQAVFLYENLEWELHWAIANDLGFITKEGLPSKLILETFHKLYPDELVDHHLTEKEVNLVGYLTYLMESVSPDEWFNRGL